MLESSWIRVIVALGAIGLWSLGGADVRAEEVSGEAQQASDSAAQSAAGCQGEGKPCCGACQKRAALIGEAKAAAAPCPCQRAKAAREAAEADQ
jgi:hypothetical protein